MFFRLLIIAVSGENVYLHGRASDIGKKAALATRRIPRYVEKQNRFFGPSSRTPGIHVFGL